MLGVLDLAAIIVGSLITHAAVLWRPQVSLHAHSELIWLLLSRIGLVWLGLDLPIPILIRHGIITSLQRADESSSARAEVRLAARLQDPSVVEALANVVILLFHAPV